VLQFFGKADRPGASLFKGEKSAVFDSLTIDIIGNTDGAGFNLIFDLTTMCRQPRIRNLKNIEKDKQNDDNDDDAKKSATKKTKTTLKFSHGVYHSLY
jgi:hypothetical protein